MTLYAIGDVQGCYDELRKLLDQIRFDNTKDQLWFTGDLVNRGPNSLEVLRFVKQLGNSALTILGNHDLHLIGLHTGLRNSLDTLEPVLNAPDREELLDWLRKRPLLHHDATRNLCMVHAGLPPQWSLLGAKSNAREIHELLSADDYRQHLKHFFGSPVTHWDEHLPDRLRQLFTVSCLTRIRYCTSDGGIDLQHKGPPNIQTGLIPWFEYPHPAWHGARFVVGHWASLGVHLSRRVIAIDSGCVWGGALTAVNLDHDFELQCVDCPGSA